MTSSSEQSTFLASCSFKSCLHTILTAAVVTALLAVPAVATVAPVTTQASVSGEVTTQDSPTVTVADREVLVGETVTVPVTLSQAPRGMAGFNLSVAPSDPTVVTILNVTVDDKFGLANPSVDGTEGVLLASDVGEEVQSGATDVRLGTVTVRAESTGTARLQVNVTQLDDNQGSRIAPEVDPGEINVGDESTNTPTQSGSPPSTDTPAQSGSPSPTDTPAREPTETSAPAPGFSVLIAITALIGTALVALWSRGD